MRSSRPNSVLSASQLSGDNTADTLPLSSGRPVYQSIAIQTSLTDSGPTTPTESSRRAAPPEFKPEILTYSKAVQTDDLKHDRPESPDGSVDLQDGEGEKEDEEDVPMGTARRNKRSSRRERERDEEIRAKLRQEIEEELQAAKQAVTDGVPVADAAQPIRYPLRTLTDDELKAVTSSMEFLDFVDRSSKVIERALDEEYDILADYELGGLDHDLADDDEYGKKKRGIKEVCQFWDERWSKKRMVSDLSFAPKVSRLIQMYTCI